MELKDLEQLMIGNYILEGGKPTLLDRNLFYNILKYWDKVKDNYGFIKLNPSLLEMLGFEKQNDLFSILDLSYPIRDFYIQQANEIDTYQFFINEEYTCDLITLNQLQNLFYSLTEIQLIDIVAYNYYKTFNLANPHNFNEFLMEKEKIDLNDGFYYHLGDLPQNLFE